MHNVEHLLAILSLVLVLEADDRQNCQLFLFYVYISHLILNYTKLYVILLDKSVNTYNW